ncbi:MAG: DNA primase [Candidatus Sericytochromatia bacterium]|nr:DNA primase [Candidatus Sericytochromatia bacterium]
MDDRDRVRDAARIVEVIGAHTVLKRRGRGWSGLCPFHGERTPSFSVLEDPPVFRCFGCGEKGDVFAFVMKKEGLDFPAALRHLAERYGVTLSDRPAQGADRRRELREVLAEAAEFYRRQLREAPEGKEARDYLEERGLSAATAERFGLGVAPAAWDALAVHLRRRGFDPEIQEEAGLVRANDRGGWRDLFRHRLMFPIATEMGAVVAFGGRLLPGGDGPKYLNSPETPVYQKGHQLYALHLAKEAIRQADRALLVEGYMDAVALHQAGIHEAVGVLGTALTPDQARSLLRFTEGKRVVVAFDADQAGRQAADRGGAVLEEVAHAAGMVLRVLTVPEGKDPDAYVRAFGAEAFRGLLEEAPDLVTFRIERILASVENPRGAEGRRRILEGVGPLLGRLGSQVMAEPHVRTVARHLGVSEDAVARDLLRWLPTVRTSLRTTAVAAPVVKQRAAEALRGLLSYLVHHPEGRGRVAERLDPAVLPDEAAAIFVSRVLADPVTVGWTAWQALLEGTVAHELLLDLCFGEERVPEHDGDLVVQNYIDALHLDYWERMAADIRRDLSRSGMDRDEANRLTVAHLEAVRRVKEYQARLAGRFPEPGMGHG